MQKTEVLWQHSLEVGDRCLATIRHATDGKQNRHNVEVIVISNNRRDWKILAYENGNEIELPYNELKKKEG